jgi:hypothetical protein
MEYVLVVIAVMVVLWLIMRKGNSESFSENIRFQSIASGSPVPYDAFPVMEPGAHRIRRWRTPIPQTGTGYIKAPNWSNADGILAAEMPEQPIIPRQIDDDVWARTYAPGIGFQLG